MAIRYKNPQTGEYEVIKIPVMKGEQGHAGIHVGTDAPPTTDVKLWFDPSDTDNDVDLANRLDTTLTACYDYMGNDRGSIKAAADANVDWLLGEINTVHHDGQHITATDTIEGRSKSAILTGQTLVNLIDMNNIIQQSSTTYLVPLTTMKSEITIITTNKTVNKSPRVSLFNEDGEWVRNESTSLTNNKIHYKAESGLYVKELVFTTNNVASHPYSYESLEQFKEQGFIVIEGNYENGVSSYFEGMQSVKLPVLTTTGKNLFNPNNVVIDSSNTYGYIDLSKHETLTFSITDKDTSIDMSSIYFGATYLGYNYDGTNHRGGGWLVSNGEFVRSSLTTTQCKYFSFHPCNKATFDKIIARYNIQIEEGSTVTSYEPYKSNILTVNEPIELRGIGDVKDELNLLTGEKVERIGEVVLDGSIDEKWYTITGPDAPAAYVEGYVSAYTYLDNFQVGTSTRLINDKGLPRLPYANTNSEGLFYLNSYIGRNALILRIDESKVNNSIREYLQANPITIQYQLATESIKTVDLSDNHVYSYKDVTHYDCSSEEGSLVPTLSIDVPTNLSALVTKQRQQIRTLEEENKELNQELQLAITSSEESDNELLAQSFELDFRLMEVECALDLPMAATFRLGGKAMAMTPYEMAKKLILADNYDRADMEHKLDVYVSKKRMTEAERQELIQLMDEKEGIVEIDPSEPEVEESIIEHEAVTIPLH